MRIHAIVVLLFAAGAWAGAASGPKHVIPVELYRNSVWLQVGVNGSKPLSFILDSAAARCVIARDTEPRSAIRAAQGAVRTTSGGKSILPIIS